MKRSCLVLLSMVLTVSVASAQIKLGGHGSYSTSGDVTEEAWGYGAQIVAPLNEAVSLELSGSRFEDDASDLLTLEVTQFALTLRVAGPLNPDMRLYVGGGVNFNQFDMEIDVPFVSVEMDDEVGFHACGGLEIKLSETLELFGEYRYSWVDATATVSGFGMSETVAGSYDFGLVRVGLNFIF